LTPHSPSLRSQQYDRPLQWLAPPAERRRHAKVRYSGPLARSGHRLVLHLGHDGWSSPADVAMERLDGGAWTAEVETEGRLVLDCVVRDEGSSRCDNNDGVDYRLWPALDPVDAHVHVRERGNGSLGFDSLRIAEYSGGFTHAVVSWADNRFVERIAADVPWLSRLVWVSPERTSVESLRAWLDDGAVGLKLHPAYDNYPADTPALDPYLTVAADVGVPVTVHSGPGPADPDLIRRLAERFPSVRFVLYHTYLGPFEGRRRASRHAQELPNLYLETSWCGSGEVERLLDEIGPDRVLFGSDAATDGPAHFVREPPNIELSETYNRVLLRLAQRLPPDVLRKLLEANARALFALPPVTAPPVTIPPAGPGKPSRPQTGPTPAELRSSLASALAQLRRLIGRVRREQLALPTPCAHWDVRALLGHVLAVVQRSALVGEGAPTVGGAQMVPIEPGHWRHAFETSAGQAHSAWARPQALTGTTSGPWGMVPAPVALSGFVLELVAHAWDLAVGIGEPARLDPDLAAAAMRIATRLAPAELRDDGGAFGPPRTAPAGADPATQLAAYLGRRVPGFEA
jgi:uncharacterized protein (TIGR03086 family)